MNDKELAVLKTEVKQISRTLNRLDASISSLHDKLDSLDTKFITRSEGHIASVGVVIVSGAISAIAAIISLFHTKQ